MKSLFNTTDNQEIIDRVNRVIPGSEPFWGKMNAGQMLAHCQQPLKVAFGETKGSRSLAGRLFGKIAKKQLLADKPMKKNLPTDSRFVIKDSRSLKKKKQN